tara:strand:- start:70 stop:273 length:204 start_codon:yes stop_codon:yes gene_type:complete
MARYSKELTIKHWKTDLRVNKHLMLEYLMDSFNLDLPKEIRLYCQRNFVEHKSLVNNAYKKLTQLGE